MKQTKLFAITALFALFASHNSFSQTGATCSDAITLIPTDSTDYSNHTTADTVFWFEFTATSPYVNISLETAKYGLNVPHIHSIQLFSGSCTGLNMIAEDELPHYSEAKLLNIDLNASNLSIGQTYFIRVDRKVPNQTCSRAGCTANNSTDPSTFSISIKRIFLVIPPDMLIEPPTSGWGMEVNRGQLLDTNGDVAEEVKIYNDHSNPGVFICEDRISYVFVGEQSSQKAYQKVDMTFLNANADYGIFKTEEVAGFTNYYLPHIPDGITKNKAYSRVVLNGIYDKIDYHQYSNKNGLKNYFIIYPGAKTENIRLQFDGLDSLIIDSLNHLYVQSTLGTMEFEKPHVYTIDSTGFPQAILCNAEYELVDDSTIGFQIVGYSGTEPLIIVMDQGHSAAAPKSIDNLLWSTYYGNTEDDYIEDIDHDGSGNVYFTGYTTGLTFPHTTQTVYSPSTTYYTRIIVGSHKPLGERNWSTIYGAQTELASGIATDQLGNVYVTGLTGVYSEPNKFLAFTKVGAYNLAPSTSTVNATYATLYRFNQSNGARTWATLFGEHTTNADFRGKCIATDNSGNVYIAGEGKRVSSSPIVATGSQYSQSTTGTKVGFIAKFNAANALTWSTMFGNNDLVVNEMNTIFNPQTSQNELFIVGTTGGTNTNSFPMTAELLNDYQASYQGGASDAFFAKFNSSDVLRWSSFFGGAGEDLGLGIDYNPSTTSLFITGQTKSNSTTFPLQSLSNPQIHFNNTLSGASDGFISVLKFITETTGGHILYYSSYFGGSSDDQCGNVEISDAGNVYVIGMSKSTNFPLQNLNGNYNQPVLENDPTGVHYDSFILGLNPWLAYGWGTYFGGEWYYNGSNVNAASNDYGNGITVYNDQILYIGGSTNSNQDFPITVDLTASPNAYIQYDNSGSAMDLPLAWTDGFLAQFDLTDVVLGLHDLDNDETNGNLTVYPNPSTGNFSIVGSNLKLEGKINIEVINVIGQRIYSKSSTVSNGQLTEFITLGNLSNGIYIVNIGDGTNKLSKRVVIR
ncbi:SBBP repeat-containing protein [Fluviicola sp.]|uniref:DUF7948 domain-containing protein n=1 Tax=Fluviicola sp. TaxID=1917219 RepID=UPI0031D49BC5